MVNTVGCLPVRLLYPSRQNPDFVQVLDGHVSEEDESKPIVLGSLLLPL